MGGVHGADPPVCHRREEGAVPWASGTAEVALQRRRCLCCAPFHPTWVEKLTIGEAPIDEEKARRLASDLGDQQSPVAESSDCRDVLNFALYREGKAIEFYTHLADVMPAGEVRDFLLARAAEEQRHQDRLRAFCQKLAY